MITKVVAFSIACSIVAFCEDSIPESISINIGIEESGSVNPRLYIPLQWSEGWSSGIGLTSTTSSLNSELNGFDDSRLNSTEIFTGIIFVPAQKIINYSINTFRIGLRGEYDYITSTEFGYVHFPSTILDDYIAFDNMITLKSIYPAIDFSHQLQSTNISLRTRLAYSPIGVMSIHQNTSFKPIISSPAIYNANTSKVASLNASVLAALHYEKIILCLRGAFIQRNYTYNIQTLNISSTTGEFLFDREEIVSRERILTGELLVGYDIPSILKNIGISPQIGFGFERKYSDDLKSKESMKNDGKYMTIGLEKLF